MYHRILVPIDGSPSASDALDEAIRMATAADARLRLIHLAQSPSGIAGFEPHSVYLRDVAPAIHDAGEMILAAGRRRVEQSGVVVETRLIEGSSSCLADVVAHEAGAWNADLIAIGAHGRRGIGRWLLGNDAEQILRAAPVPVLLVRAPDAISLLMPAKPAEIVARIDPGQAHTPAWDPG